MPRWSAPVLLIGLLWAVSAAGSPAGVDPAEEAVLAKIEARDLNAARAAIQGLGANGGEGQRARRVELLELCVALAADELPGEGPLARLGRLRDRVEARDLGLLREMEAVLGPVAGVYLAPLRRAASSRVGPRLPRSLLVELARDEDAELRRLAVSALAAQVLPFRARVMSGEDLGPSEQRALASPELIALLVERLADRAAGGATDAIPADLAAATPGGATALHGLVLIEAPALDVLRDNPGRPGAREAIAAIESAITVRLRRHPASTWCSAKGETPREGPTRGACKACARVLPAAARFCPACGARAKIPCPTCLAALDVGAEHCTGCGAAVAAPRTRSCPACRAAVRAPGRFCPECGVELRTDREE